VAGEYEASEEAFAKALELHPNWIWGHIKKAYAHMYQGEYSAAMTLAKKSE